MNLPVSRLTFGVAVFMAGLGTYDLWIGYLASMSAYEAMDEHLVLASIFIGEALFVLTCVAAIVRITQLVETIRWSTVSTIKAATEALPLKPAFPSRQPPIALK
jgi:hypothetical protein